MKISFELTKVSTITFLWIIMAATSLKAQDVKKEKGNVIAQRTEVMKLMASKMEMIHKMLDGALLFKADAFSHGVKELKDKSGDHLITLFPKGSQSDKSRAKPQIWTDFSSFEAYAKSLHSAAKEMERNATTAIKNGHIVKAQEQLSRGSYSNITSEMNDKSTADMKMLQKSFLDIAKNCKGCHEKFQKPKDKKAQK